MNPSSRDESSDFSSTLPVPAEHRERRTPWARVDWLLLLLITTLGAGFRFYNLGVTPPGFQFDEAYNAIDAVQVLAGNRPIFLPANGGREVLFTYFQAGLVWLFGASVWTFRLAAALWGTAGVAATFVLFRMILRRESRLIAACGAFALAISYWHIHYSHFGIRVITMPVIFSGLFGLYWAATQSRRPQQARLLYLAAGLVLGLSVYSNPTGRLAPLVLIGYTVWLLWRYPTARRFTWSGPLGGLVLAGTAAAVVFLPLGITFVRHPEFFLGHAAEVSVFAERVSGEAGPVSSLLKNALHVAGMFSFYGDREWTHGISRRPVLDWVISIPFLIGALVWAARLVGRRRADDEDLDALWLLLLWAVVMLAPSILSDAAPNTSRTLPSLPASYLPLAFGLAWIVWLPVHPADGSVRSLWPRRWMGYMAAGLIVTASAAITAYDYFIRYPAIPEVYHSYDVDKLDALNLLQARGQESAVFLSPLWGNHATVRFLRDQYDIRTLDALQALVLPPDMSAVYAFTSEEENRARWFAERWPGLEVETALDKYGKPLLFLVTTPATPEGEWPMRVAPSTLTEARFDDAPTFLGAQMAEDGSFHLFWRAETTTFRNLTAFVHFVDQFGNRVAQVDRVPGEGSFETPNWRTGERVIDMPTPVYGDACAAGVPVRAYVGWYEWAAGNARRPRVDAQGTVVLAGEFELPVRPYFTSEGAGVEATNPEVPAPAVALTQDLGEATLLGYTLHDESPQAGAVATIDLFMQADAGDVQKFPIRLNLANATRILLSTDATLSTAAPMAAGDKICRRVQFRLPADSTGEWTIQLETPEGALELGTMYVSSPPATQDATYATPVGALFGDGLRLAGVTLGKPEDGSLPVDVVWKLEAESTWPMVVSLQLLDGSGRLLAQVDGPPGAKPLLEWPLNTVVTERRVLALPTTEVSESWLVSIAAYDPQTLEREVATAQAGGLLVNGAVNLPLSGANPD